MITLVLSNNEFDALTDAVDSAITDLENYLPNVNGPLDDDLESGELKDLLDRWHKLRAKLTATPTE